MTFDGNPIARLAQALDHTGAIIARIRPAQSGLPTPCRAWDVRALVNHLVQVVRLHAAIVGGAAGSDSDVIGDDWAMEYCAAAGALLAAWRRVGVLDGTVQLPIGEVSAASCVELQIAELLIHGWDLATATGQPTGIDPELGKPALAWARQNLLPQFRGDEGSGRSFGAEMPVPEAAPLHDRLAAFFGRTLS